MEFKAGDLVKTRKGLTVELSHKIKDGVWIGSPVDEEGRKMYNFVHSKLITAKVNEADIVQIVNK